MEGRPGIKHPRLRVTPPSVKEFVWLKLTEYGWFSTEEDNKEVAHGITCRLIALCINSSYSEAFHILFDGQAQTDFALEISTKFLSLDPAPNDPNLRSFVSSIFSFYEDFFWSQRIQPNLRKFNYCQSANDGSPVSDDSSVSSDTQDNKLIASTESILRRFFEFPGEIRNMIYKDILIAPENTLLRGFTPPPLLCASKRLRGEALPLFYQYNNFEITVQRSPQDQVLAGGRRLPSVDMRVWRRFLDMWNVFNASGTNGLQYVERVTVIYQLSARSGMPFGTDYAYDRRLGFRFSRTPFEEDGVESHDEARNAGNNESSEGSDDSSSESSDGDGDYCDRECHYAALNRGTFDWPNRSETQRLLFEKTRECRAGRLWKVHPLPRLANMLWRCARDCPQAAQNVDFLYPDLYREGLSSKKQYGKYDEESFFDPDDEDDERQIVA
ncbi:hypothetical protein SLS63_004888 [Diaporthe eres]|uniref:Uncharacterized protein n=1 Tax=Diaporthe eres TaxID=83184 RepID=A0ABR1PCI8_DIAER